MRSPERGCGHDREGMRGSPSAPSVTPPSHLRAIKQSPGVSMKTDVRLSTRFLTTQNAHQVGMLVTLEGETPVRRPPVNVALVLDRSGSMSGPAPAGTSTAAEAIARVAPGGSTNLSGGWLKGARLVGEGIVEGTNRV